MTKLSEVPFNLSDNLNGLNLIDYDVKDKKSFAWGSKVNPTSRGRLEGIKLLLDPDQPVPLYVPASNTKKELQKLGKPPLDVASDYLRALYNHALGYINASYPKEFVEMQQKRFVLTVPAVWSDKAKDLTLKVSDYFYVADLGTNGPPGS